MEKSRDFELTKKYYSITDQSYRFLDSNGTHYMNLGFWPADSISMAQENLVNQLLSFSSIPSGSSLSSILELGPGWGGARKNFFEFFPSANYLGVNLSSDQIEFCKTLNQNIPNTNYVEGNFEAIESLVEFKTNFKMLSPSLAIGIESVIHLENKEALFQSLKRMGVTKLLLAEICGDGKELIKQESLFYPSLNFIAPLSQYQSIADRNQFKIRFKDISKDVFVPWASALKSVPVESFKGSRKVLDQFVKSYQALAKAYLAGKVFYYFIELEF